MNRDTVYLQHIQEMIGHLQRLMALGKPSLLNDLDLQMAMAHYTQLMAQSVMRLSDTLLQTQPEINWAGIRGFRNRIVHEYMGFDFELIWTILDKELPTLQKAIATMLIGLDDI
ncbi:MAG: DUF86 domain-containing protein [Anaerolineae bacterium]|jgi:uncharacterized protein with HEPN domain|nr:DUF86 domain-containing protein [Anaerolineae bacterium]